LRLATPRQEQHDSPEGEEDQATPEVDVDTQRLLVHGGVRTRRQAVDSQDDAEHGEHQADRKANIDLHGCRSGYQKIKLRTSVAARTMMPRKAGCLNQGTPGSLILGVSE